MMLLHKAAAHPLLLTLAGFTPAHPHITPQAGIEERRLIVYDIIFLQVALILAGRGASVFYTAQRRTNAGERTSVLRPAIWMLFAALVALMPTFMNAWNCPTDHAGPECLNVLNVLKKLLLGSR